MAMMVGAMTIHNIQPGPQVMTSNPGLFWGLIASMWVGNLMLVVLNLPMIGMWIKLLTVPYRILYPAILLFCAIGVYTINNTYVDIIITAFFGFIGVLFMKLGCEPAPLLLGFVLGPMMEENLRRAMLLSRGDPTTFLTRPISARDAGGCRAAGADHRAAEHAQEARRSVRRRGGGLTALGRNRRLRAVRRPSVGVPRKLRDAAIDEVAGPGSCPVRDRSPRRRSPQHGRARLSNRHRFERRRPSQAASVGDPLHSHFLATFHMCESNGQIPVHLRRGHRRPSGPLRSSSD